MEDLASFKQITIDRKIGLLYREPFIRRIEDIKGEVCIKRSYIVKGESGVSLEGQILTGNSLIVHGLIGGEIIYISRDRYKPILKNFSMPFSTFIMLPSDFSEESEIEVSSLIKDIDAIYINDEEIHITSSILLSLNSICK